MRHSSYLEVSLRMLGDNFYKIKNLAPAAEVLPMVKADAYGNGIIPVSRFLTEECGVMKLGCATLGEAQAILRETPSMESEILVFSELELSDARSYTDFNITPVLYRAKDLELILSKQEFRKVPVIIKLNTGMNRLGLTWEELSPFIPRLKGRGIRHLMTHFAALNRLDKQYAIFERIKSDLTAAGISIEETSVSSSVAIEKGLGINETYVRPGLMLYGPHSLEERVWDGHQVSRLVTKIIKTFQVKKGTPVGYGTFVTGEDYFMVIVSAGYGDGVLTYMSGAEIQVKGHTARVFGRVNMDMTFLAFHPSVEGKLKEDESIELWNHDNRVITSIAAQMKTHPYQLMCAVTSRIPRIYI